jgi:hypothetical protein
MRVFVKKSERYQINELMMHIKVLEKQEKAKPKISSWKKMIKIRSEIKGMKTKTIRQWIYEDFSSLKR